MKGIGRRAGFSKPVQTGGGSGGRNNFHMAQGLRDADSSFKQLRSAPGTEALF
jgi:hypothetical protein